jgi:hypothetical protein
MRVLYVVPVTHRSTNLVWRAGPFESLGWARCAASLWKAQGYSCAAPRVAGYG